MLTFFHNKFFTLDDFIFQFFSIIYIYIYFEECIFRQQVIVKASFIKDDGTLLVYYF